MDLRVCHACRRLAASGTVCGTCQGKLVLADGSLLVGELFGKYRIDGLLGAGGMGIVYTATHQTLERHAAVKIVVPAPGEKEFDKRFLREAKLLGELKHPNIVDVYDFDVSSWSVPFLVMERLEGMTLRELLDREMGTLDPELLAPIVRDVAAGLAYAHEKGVVHRDLKPENVFVALYHDRAVGKLLDFGIAKVLEGRETSRLTMSGVLVGTPYYLSPEQLLVAPIGPAVDQYALALIVAEALTGHAVREGKTLGQIYAVDIQQPVAAASLAADLSPAVAAAVERATQPAPQERFESVAAFVAALELPEGDPRRLARLLRSDGTTGSKAVPSTPSAVAPAPVPALRSTERHGAGPSASGEVAGAAPPAAASRSVVTPPPPAAALALLATGEKAAPTPAEIPPPPVLTRRQWGILALGLVAGAAGVEYLGPRRRRRFDDVSGPPTKPAAAREVGLHATRDIPVPADVRAIVAASADTILLQGAAGIYVLPSDGSGIATAVAFPGRFVGGAPEGRFDVVLDGALVRRDVAEEQRTVLVSSMPALEATERIHVGPGGDVVAIEKGDRLVVHRVEGGALAVFLELPRDPSRELHVALGRRFLGVAEPGGRVRIHAVADGANVVDAPMQEQKLHGLALLEDAGLLAACGWFDRVLLYDLDAPQGPPRALARRGPTSSLGLLPDHPTVVTAGQDGLRAFRGDAELPARISGKDYASLLLSAGRILALDRRAHVLTVAAYHDGPLPPAVAISPTPVWCLESDPFGKCVLAGGADGVLSRLDPASGAITRHELHSDGLTSMARHGAHLATASDDKTIAIRRLPDLEVLWRTRSHGFLVNAVRIHGDPPTLWSSSSDGALKQWDFPQLAERRVVATTDILGEKSSLGSFWVSPREERILAGTWNYRLLDLSLDADGRWSAQARPVESWGLYSMVELRSVEALLVVGVHPSALYLVDLRTGALHRAAFLDLAVAWGIAGEDEHEAWLGASGALIHYRLERDAAGVLSLEARTWLDADLGNVQALALLDDGRLAAGNDAGQLRLLTLDPSSRQVVARQTFPS